MRIKALQIDGFGLFCDQQVDDIASGLCLFFGDNEAGKSTMLAFIRSILFGFPGGKANRYKPLRGGNYGGSLTLLTDGGERYVVRRSASHRVAGEVSITCPDGSVVGEQFVPSLLGSATRDLFESIFAFSLTELQELSKLTSERVKGVIYSAGMGSLRRSLPEVYAALNKRMSEIFAHGGRKPEINKILKELESVGRRLGEIDAATGRYDELKERFARSETEIEQLERDKRNLSLELKSLEGRLMAWDHWVALESARLELEQVPFVERFPAAGLAKLEGLQQNLDAARRDLRECAQKQEDQQKKLEQIDVDEPLLAQADAIQRLQMGRKHYDAAVRDLPVREQECRDSNKRLSDKLLELGPDWDREKLLSFDRSIGRRESIREFQAKFDDAREKESEARNILNVARREAEKASKRADELRNAFEAISEPFDKEERVLVDRIEKLEQTERLLGKKLRYTDSLADLKERETDLRAQTLPWRLERGKWLGACLRALSLLAPAGGIIFAVSAFTRSPSVAIIIAVLALALAYVLDRVRRQQKSADLRIKEQIEQIEARITMIGHKRDAISKELETVETTIQQNRSSLGIEYELDENNVAREIARAKSELEKCKRWRKARSDWEAAQRATDEAKQELEVAIKRHSDALKTLEATRAEWQEWLSGAGLSENLSHSGALEVLSCIDACRTIDDEAQKLSSRIELMSSEVHKYADEVRKTAYACGRELRSGDDPGIFLDTLSEELKQAEKNRGMREKLEASLSESAERLEELSGKVRRLEAEMASLLKSGGASSVEEFQDRAKWYERRQDLEEEMRRSRSELERIAGPGKLEELESRLRASQREKLEVERDALREKLEQVERSREELLDRRGSLRKELEQLEAEDESSELRLKREALLARLRQLARRWSVLRISGEILRQAQDIYERERQPGVIREASSLFERMTCGRYTRIIKPLGENATFDVLTPREERREINQLSQGTKEQLFLALRFGLVKEFAQRHESLPLVMDDVLVNFDYRRARATAELLHKLSESHQVLLFTCHQETLELVGRVAPETQVFTLSDGTIQGE